MGDRSIVKDSENIDRCLIETTKVTVRPFWKVSAAFAFKEGEGDRSLAYWRKVHKKFFTKRLRRREGEFDGNILVVCEEFKVLKIFQS